MGKKKDTFVISRFIEGICLNPREFVLDDDGEVMEFKTRREAAKFVGYASVGAAAEDWVFITPKREVIDD